MLVVRRHLGGMAASGACSAINQPEGEPVNGLTYGKFNMDLGKPWSMT